MAASGFRRVLLRSAHDLSAAHEHLCVSAKPVLRHLPSGRVVVLFGVDGEVPCPSDLVKVFQAGNTHHSAFTEAMLALRTLGAVRIHSIRCASAMPTHAGKVLRFSSEFFFFQNNHDLALPPNSVNNY